MTKRIILIFIYLNSAINIISTDCSFLFITYLLKNCHKPYICVQATRSARKPAKRTTGKAKATGVPTKLRAYTAVEYAKYKSKNPFEF